MKLRSDYDWVVLGDHPGAILGGAMAARLGHSVLILPFKREDTVRRTSRGKIIDLESNYLLGLTGSGKSSGVAVECMRFLYSGKPHWPLPDASPIEGCISHVATPKARIKLLNEGMVLGNEVCRELGPAGEGSALDWKGISQASEHAEAQVHLHWRKLPERLVTGRSKRRFVSQLLSQDRLEKKVARRLGQESSPDVRSWSASGGSQQSVDLRFSGGRAEKEVLDGIWHSLTGALPVVYSPVSLLHMLILSGTGARVRGGISAYRNYLFEVARAWGAHVLFDSKVKCQAVFVENGALRGIQLQSQGKMISTGSMLLGSSLAAVRRHLSSTGRDAVWKIPTSPQGWVFSVSLAVDWRGVPPGAGNRVIWSEEGASPIEIEVAESSEYDLVDKQLRLVHLRTILPFTQESLVTKNLRLTAARMVRLYSELFPFSMEHLKWIFPDFREDGGELESVYGTAGLGELPEFLWSDYRDGVGYESGVQNLFLANN
ncbi:MAG: hypothetical protein AAB425_01730, partial [Bdellovibrionota bacterium]